MRYDIETNYGYGWEVESSYDDYESALADLKEYILLTQHYGGRVRLVESEGEI